MLKQKIRPNLAKVGSLKQKLKVIIVKKKKGFKILVFIIVWIFFILNEVTHFEFQKSQHTILQLSQTF